jgi:predicted GNAT family N-acyltransferase
MPLKHFTGLEYLCPYKEIYTLQRVCVLQTLHFWNLKANTEHVALYKIHSSEKNKESVQLEVHTKLEYLWERHVNFI